MMPQPQKKNYGHQGMLGEREIVFPREATPTGYLISYDQS